MRQKVLKYLWANIAYVDVEKYQKSKAYKLSKMSKSVKMGQTDIRHKWIMHTNQFQRPCKLAQKWLKFKAQLI